MTIQWRNSILLALAFAVVSVFLILYQPADVTFKLMLVLAAVVPLCIGAGQWAYNRNKWIDLALDFGFSLLVALLIFRIYPGEFFDDAGFEMRYLENFRDGYFYSYNPADGPVFGISSPFQGLLNGFLCYTHIMIPEQAMRRTAFAGLVFTVFFLVKIVRNRSESQNYFLLYVLLIVCGSKMFLNVAKSGLETPLHLSLIAAALWCYYSKREKLFWLLLAVSVISKLDAVPFAVVLGLAWLVEHRKSYLPISFRNKHLLNILVFAVLPVVLWIVFATAVFGSPLPQSAYSKIHHHGHPDDHWFPFFTRYIQDPYFNVLLVLVLVTGLAVVFISYITKKADVLKNVIPGLAYIATMVLYYFYNPGERMLWYYALPDILLILQLVTALLFLLNYITHGLLKTATAGLVGFSLLFFLLPDVTGGKYWITEYLSTVEYERNNMGKYLGERVAAGDTLMTWHGMTGRYTKGYVLDMSGLNSKVVTEYNRDIFRIRDVFKPNWVVKERDGYVLDAFNRPPYSFDTAFYDITYFEYPEWLVFKRVPEGASHQMLVFAGENNVKKGKFSSQKDVQKVSGSFLQFTFRDSLYMTTAFILGAQKLDTAYYCDMELIIGDSVADSFSVKVEPHGRAYAEEAFKVQPVKFAFRKPLPPGTQFVINLRRKGISKEMLMISPAIIIRD
jgi:hypothetical protein